MKFATLVLLLSTLYIKGSVANEACTSIDVSNVCLSSYWSLGISSCTLPVVPAFALENAYLLCSDLGSIALCLADYSDEYFLFNGQGTLATIRYLCNNIQGYANYQECFSNEDLQTTVSGCSIEGLDVCYAINARLECAYTPTRELCGDAAASFQYNWDFANAETLHGLLGCSPTGLPLESGGPVEQPTGDDTGPTEGGPVDDVEQPTGDDTGPTEGSGVGGIDRSLVYILGGLSACLALLAILAAVVATWMRHRRAIIYGSTSSQSGLTVSVDGTDQVYYLDTPRVENIYAVIDEPTAYTL